MSEFNNNDDELTPEEDSSDLWLVSYADMMTLVACFFILMMAFANYDPVGFAKKTKEVAKHFSGKNLDKEKTRIEELVLEIQGHPDLKKITKVAELEDGLRLIFQTNQLFSEGSSDLLLKSNLSLDILADMIKEREDAYRIIIEGHTDSLESKKNGKFSNTWELSAARAATVLTRFINAGFDSKNLVLTAKGDSEPIAPNKDKDGLAIIENMALNRRVEIKILKPINTKKYEKLGLGVYFDDAELVKGLGEE